MNLAVFHGRFGKFSTVIKFKMPCVIGQRLVCGLPCAVPGLTRKFPFPGVQIKKKNLVCKANVTDIDVFADLAAVELDSCARSVT